MARHKEFDRDEALHKAMEVFWSRGYNAASIQDLVRHMRINRQSLYDTFGDKHALYLQALDRYREVEGRTVFELLARPAQSRKRCGSCATASLKDRSATVSGAAASWVTRCRSWLAAAKRLRPKHAAIW